MHVSTLSAAICLPNKAELQALVCSMGEDEPRLEAIYSLQVSSSEMATHKPDMLL